MKMGSDSRPFALGPFYLAATSLLSIGCVVALELIYRWRLDKDGTGQAVLFSFHGDFSDLTRSRYFVWQLSLPIALILYTAFIQPIQLARELFKDPPMVLRVAVLGITGMVSIVAPVAQITVFHATNPPDKSLRGDPYAVAASQHVRTVIMSPVGTRVLECSCGLTALMTLLLTGYSVGWRSDLCRNWENPENRRHRDGQWYLLLLISVGVFGVSLMIFFIVANITTFAFLVREHPWALMLFFALFKRNWTECDTTMRVVHNDQGHFTATAPIYLPIKAAMNNAWVLFFIAITSLCVEFLIISASCSGDIAANTMIYVGYGNFTPGDFAHYHSTFVGNEGIYSLYQGTFFPTFVVFAATIIASGTMTAWHIAHTRKNRSGQQAIRLSTYALSTYLRFPKATARNAVARLSMCGLGQIPVYYNHKHSMKKDHLTETAYRVPYGDVP